MRVQKMDENKCDLNNNTHRGMQITCDMLYAYVIENKKHNEKGKPRCV